MDTRTKLPNINCKKLSKTDKGAFLSQRNSIDEGITARDSKDSSSKTISDYFSSTESSSNQNENKLSKITSKPTRISKSKAASFKSPFSRLAPLNSTTPNKKKKKKPKNKIAYYKSTNKEHYLFKYFIRLKKWYRVEDPDEADFIPSFSKKSVNWALANNSLVNPKVNR